MTFSASGEGHLELILTQLAAVPGCKYQAHARAALHVQRRRRLKAISSQRLQQPCDGVGSVDDLDQKSGIQTQGKRIIDDDDTATTASSSAGDDSADAHRPRSFSDCGLSELGSRKGIAVAPEVSPERSRLLTHSSAPTIVASFATNWPSPVRKCLEEPEAVARLFCKQLQLATDEEKRLEGSSGLRLVAGSCSYPHPEKAAAAGIGADSYFIAKTGTAVGVADGVGEWEWRFKCNPRAFADELMWGAQAQVQDSASKEHGNAAEGAVRALRRGFEEAKSIGSATALVAVLNSAKRILGVANLGDSTLLQLRRDRFASSQGLFRCVGRTVEQQHSFNCPYQLRCIPTEADYPRLIAEGKHALVRAVQRCQSKEDLPEDADKYLLPVMPGDLLVLGTDGVFDNLHDHEVCALVSQSISPVEAQDNIDIQTGVVRGSGEALGATAPDRLATAIAEAARHRSQDPTTKSPFAVHAQKAGLFHAGGKMDDITCVCAWVVNATWDSEVCNEMVGS